MRFLVVGAGRQGRAVAADLGEGVRLVDFALAGGDRLDVRDSDALDRAMNDCDVAIGCVPYRLQPLVAESALRVGRHALDLGCDTPDARNLLARDDEARGKGVCIVPDCGLAPGIANMLAAEAIRRVENPREARLYCGVLPQDRGRPLGYKISFALDGLIGEYEDLAYAVRDGEALEVPSLERFETLEFGELGQLEAFVTSGGAGTSPDLWAGKLRSYEYKTLRYAGHGQAMRQFRDLGFWSDEPLACGVTPRTAFMQTLERALTDAEAPEVAVLRVVAAGDSSVQADIALWQQPGDRFTAMERLTGWGVTIPALAVARGEVEPGAKQPELAIPYPSLERGLAERGVAVRWSVPS